MDSGDDAARHRSARREKRGKGKKRATAANGTDETTIDVDLDTGDVPEEPFDREALLNQALSQKQQAKLHSLALDTHVVLDGYKPDVMEMMRQLAGNVAEFMKNDQAKVLHARGALWCPWVHGMIRLSQIWM